MRSRTPGWVALLAVVALLLAGCDGSDEAGADTTLAATTAAPATTTTAVESFDFSTQDVCDWFSPEQIDAIVRSTYEAVGVPLDPSHMMRREQRNYTDCFFAEPVVSLIAIDGSLVLDDAPFEAHPSLNDSVRVAIPTPGIHGYDIEGISAVLEVDGHAELLSFGHTTIGLGDDVETINTLGLTIANEMLKQMGWIESP
jgi:hypothetical protein